MKNFLLICLIAIGCTTAQDIEVQKADFETLKAYHNLINQAELAIVSANYASANSSYTEAFELVPAPYIKDLYNAAIISVKLDNEQEAVSRIKRLRELNLSLEYVRSIDAFQPIIDSHSEILSAKPLPRYNESLSNTLWELHERDQSFRRHEDAYQIYGDTISAIDRENIKALLSILDKQGYPAEGDVSSKDVDVWSSLPQDIVITHSLQNHDTSFVSHLTKALHDGSLHPVKFTIFMDFLEETFAGMYGSVAYYKRDSTIHKEYNAVQQDSINTRRARIGLEPLDDYNKKALYMQFNNPDGFILGVQRAHWFIEDMPPYSSE